MEMGDRIAAYRKRRGLSQEALAGLIGMSRSWLSQVERGIRKVDRLSTLTNLAAVLRVDVAELVGRDWRLSRSDSTQVDAIESIRKALSTYSSLLEEAPSSIWPLPQLRSAVVEAHRANKAAKYQAASAMLPDILRVVDAYGSHPAADAREVHLTRCFAYAAAAKLLIKIGESHLGWLAADRAAHAAQAADSRTGQAVAAYEIACALLRAGHNDDAERIAVDSAERLMPHVRSDLPDHISLAGLLWLLSAVIAARRSDRAEAQARLATAERLGELLGHDGNHAWTAFGPTNVLIHRGSVAAELGDPYSVLATASLIDPEALPRELKGRRSQIHIDLAWAQVQARNDAEATLHLLQAERIAPEALRYSALVREMVRELVKRARRPLPGLHTLAARAGVLE